MIRLPATGPTLVAVPATSLIVALGSTGLNLGVAGIIGGAALGLAWSIALGLVMGPRMHRSRWHRWLADGCIFVAIVATGAMLGGGVMYGLLMEAAADAGAPVLAALMQPTIPFFIVLNTPLELLAVPGAVFSNWHNNARRRLILIAAAAFYPMRIWSYLVYVPTRMDIASRPLLPEDLDWFERSMGVDYRGILVTAVLLAFTAAAFVPDRAEVVASRRRS